MSLIPLNKYSKILEDLPIYCVDIIIKNDKEEYLLIKRNNEPKKGEWWVVGGRVLKGETAKEAAIRKVKQETDLQVRKIEPVGYFELVNGENPFGLPFKYHTISVVFMAIADDYQKINLDDQSTDFKFSKELPKDFNIQAFNGVV
jgi:colanic acid biosynthesis protein WcaH